MRRFKKAAIIILIITIILAGLYYCIINYSFHYLTKIILFQSDKKDDITYMSEGNYAVDNNVGDTKKELKPPVSIDNDKNSSLNDVVGKQQVNEPDMNNTQNTNSAIKSNDVDTEYGSLDSSLQKKIEDSVSMDDKRKALKLITSKLTGSDISFLISLVKGGLTGEEKSRAVNLAYKRFTQSEIDSIKILYNKYIYLLDNQK